MKGIDWMNIRSDINKVLSYVELSKKYNYLEYNSFILYPSGIITF